MAGGWTIGIIGGSGLYDISGLEDVQWIAIDTPWGAPSDEVMFGRLGGVEIRFLPRHGRDHHLPPSDINARANIDALKRAGCTDLLAISSVGSLREDLAPGEFALVEQFIDRTVARPASFFGPGCVAHVSMAEPVCPRMSDMAAYAVASAGGIVRTCSTYLAMEGPQFSTRAESRLFRELGADVVGMTAMPEARLAREAELPYALLGMVTDYDSWRDDTEFVEASNVVAQMHLNAAIARAAVAVLVAALPPEREPSPLDSVLDHALMTAPEARDRKLLARLDAVMRRVLAQG